MACRVRFSALVVRAGAAVLAATGGAAVSGSLAADSAPTSFASTHATHLVKGAIKAGLAGDADQRRQLLDQALKSYPDQPAPHWQRGQVLFEGQWRSPAEVGEAASNDARRQAYRRLRQEASQALADHLQLAQWCTRQGLEAEARYHWVNVLLADPKNKQARQQLRAREFRGRLLSEKRVAECERLEQEAEANLRKHKARFAEFCRQARSESAVLRQIALQKIRDTQDAEAIEALDAAVERYSSKEPNEAARELHLAFVAALTNMPEHQATLRLLNLAMFSPLAEVRQRAAESLRPRPTTDYVPLLMAAMTAPIEVEFNWVAAADGTVRMVETLHQSGPESDRARVRTTNYEVEGAFSRDANQATPAAVLSVHLNKAAFRAESTAASIERHNALAEDRNRRIQETLKHAVGLDLGDDVEAYWHAWRDENELQYDEVDPVSYSYEHDTYRYYYPQAPVYRTSTQAVIRARQPALGVSCFAPGTLVWTQQGARAIESITVGDLVLAQHPDTGELAYRPVRRTTVGRPADVLHLTVNGETLVATLGHRFWVEGYGWKMAKELAESAALHRVGGSTTLQTVGRGEPIACHNLVVDDFHTFFVGQSQLLVHDNSCPRPTTAITPGASASDLATGATRLCW